VSHRLTFQAGEPVCTRCKRQADGLYEVCAGHAVWCGDDYLVAWEADAMPLQQQPPLVPSTLERQQRISEGKWVRLIKATQDAPK